MIQVWGVLLTKERAAQVREWRAADDGTWRAVASLAVDAWGGDAAARGNQLFGEELCREAALMLGEDPHDDPWN
jgi:hypothetical protein